MLRLGDPLVGLGGLAVFGFSFAPFVAYGEPAAVLFGVLDVPHEFNAWSLETFLVPLTTFVIVAGLLNLAAATTRFGLRRDPELLGFRLRQLEVGLALFGFVVLLGMIASDKHAVLGARRLAEADPTFRLDEVALSTGWGAALMLIGTIVLLVGTLLNHFGVGPAIPVGGAAPPPAYGQPPPPAYGQPPGRPSSPGEPAPPGGEPAPPPGDRA
jgi:hypothetical protein